MTDDGIDDENPLDVFYFFNSAKVFEQNRAFFHRIKLDTIGFFQHKTSYVSCMYAIRIMYTQNAHMTIETSRFWLA